MTTSSSGSQGFELRPRRSPILRRAEIKNDSVRKLVLAIALGIVVVRLMAATMSGDVAGVAGPVMVVVAIFGVSFGVMRRMRLRVHPHVIERVGGLPAKRAARRDVIGVVRVPIEAFGMQEGEVDVLVSNQGRCLFRTRGRLWEDGDLDRAWATAGLGIQIAPRAMTFSQLEDWIPGSTRLWERRPFLFALLVTAPLFVVLILAIIAAVVLS